MKSLNFFIKTALLCIFAFALTFKNAIGQGNIVAPKNTNAVVKALDPDGDGNIVDGGSTFTSGISDEFNEFEGQWTKGYQLSTEPSGDLSGSCGATDVVDAGSNESAYFVGIYDPDGYPTNENDNEQFLGRIRIGKQPKGNFGYSILVDSDGKYGSNDPNQISGNDGFEYEIRLVNGGGDKGVYVDSVNGTTDGIRLASYSYSSNHIKSTAVNGCSGDAVFVDVAVDYSDLPFNPSTPIRIAASTTNNGSSAITNSGADIAGVDDLNTTESQALTDLTTMQTETALPVELKYFEVGKVENSSLLKWSTASETNNSHFKVQRRVKDDWKTIGKVRGNGTTIEVQNYRFKDAGFEQGIIHYYRLKQVDFDGSYEYSDVRSVRRAENQLSSIALDPNPVSEQLNLKIKAKADQTMQVRILNLYGQSVYQAQIGIQKGNNQQRLPVQQLDPGQYVVQLEGNETVEMKRFIKQ